MSKSVLKGAPAELNYLVILPSDSLRYERRIAIDPMLYEESKDITVCRLQTLSFKQPQIIGDWKRYVHAEGQPYYHLPRSKAKRQRFSYLVELDISAEDKKIKTEVERFIKWIEKEAEKLPETETSLLPSDVEVVIDQDMELNWSYYMVDLEGRSIFWLHDYSLSPQVIKKYGIGKLDHLEHLFASEYWVHVRTFPNHRSLPQGTMKELLCILSYYLTDDSLEIGDGQVTPFSSPDLRITLRIVNKLVGVEASEEPSAYSTYCIATMMVHVESERFRNFYGFHGARLDAHHSVRRKPHPAQRQTWLAWILLPVLLGQPNNNLRLFEEMYTDGLICTHDWLALQERLERESSIFTIFATVLLAVDISLLALPTVVGMTDNTLTADQTTLSSLTAQISMIICIGSIFIGVLHNREERVNTKDKANSYTTDSKALRYLNNPFGHPRLRLETLAIQCSLPFALLLWGMLAFAASVFTLCFDASFTFIGIAARRYSYGSVLVTVGCFVLWTVLTGWEFNSSSGNPWYMLLLGLDGNEDHRKRVEKKA